jgi:hypothetical protein
MVVTIVARKAEANGRHCCGEEIQDECCGVRAWILAGQGRFGVRLRQLHLRWVVVLVSVIRNNYMHWSMQRLKYFNIFPFLKKHQT